MFQKLLNFLIMLTSLFGYLEWGTQSRSFLYEAEWELLQKLFTDPLAAAHPLTLLPLLGQLVLLITLFQSKPDKRLTYVGIICLGLLLGMITFIGFLRVEVKMLASTLPFWAVVFWVISEFKKQKTT